MKTLLLSLFFFLTCFSISAQVPLMKVYLQDGSYKTYKITDIENIRII